MIEGSTYLATCRRLKRVEKISDGDLLSPHTAQVVNAAKKLLT